MCCSQEINMDKEDKKKAPSVEDKQGGRRKLLKSVVAGGGAATVAKLMPDQWSRPVVDSVVLPSHAQTSISPFGPFYTMLRAGMNDSSGQMAEQGFSEELLEFFTPAAQAQQPASPEIVAFTANASGESFLCASSNVTTEMISVRIQNGTTPMFESMGCLFGAEVQSGKFIAGTGWEVTVAPPGANVTTEMLILMPGGPGCSDGIMGYCISD
jgi:hypothetical protein